MRCAAAIVFAATLVAVPAVAQDRGVQAVFGVGATWGLDDTVDFRVSDEHLLVANDSQQRYAVTPGLLFRGVWRKLDAIVAANFEGKTENAFDGVMLGAALRVHERLSIGGGYVIRVGQELSPGFQSRVEELLDDPAHAADYERFRCVVACGSKREREKAYDGFPLLDPRSPKERLFVGDPIIPSANKSLFIGVFIPVNLQALLQ